MNLDFQLILLQLLDFFSYVYLHVMKLCHFIQLEGAAFEGGKGLSIWDDFVAQPGRVIDNSTGNVATDQYHRYKVYYHYYRK